MGTLTRSVHSPWQEYYPAMPRRTRRRLQTAFLVIACLLFQQVALAAYFCPMEQMPAETTEMAAHCAEMGMAQQQDNPVLCEQHCNPDHAVATDTVKLSIPALALPPLIPEPAQTRAVAPHLVPGNTLFARSDPPPRLRFCTLLI